MTTYIRMIETETCRAKPNVLIVLPPQN